MQTKSLEVARMWASAQANRALLDRETVDASLALGAALGVPQHPDRPKNWDNLIAVATAASGLGGGGIVLDAGGSKDSAFLPGMAKLGAENLLALNLDFRYPEWSGGVEYRRGDATATGLPDGSVGFYACLSVIEHGVPEAALFAEARRVLRPGGKLIVSTDYWIAGVNTRGQTAFGQPIRVYDLDGVRRLVSQLLAAGLELDGDVDLSCKDRTVSWMGMDYTFINLLATKSAG
jgi:SAM-dependent methyltransferase